MTGDRAPELPAFHESVGSTFRVHVDATTAVDVTLTEVATHDRHPAWESFSLLFMGGTPAFGQGMYPVEHPALGSFPLFLVPIISDGEGQRYEAVFNRPVT